MSGTIQPIVMPKWGLAMQEGTLTKWLVKEGDTIKPGMEICDIETSKIANAMESTVGGKLVRLIAQEGATLPVAALLGIATEGSVSDAEIDAFITKYEEEFASAAQAAAESGPKNQSVDAGGTTVNYLQMGEGGTPILFLHGFGGDLNNWMFNQPDLSSGRATYALDLPGHGASSKQVADGSVTGLAKTVLAFMDAVKIDKAHLVGHSLGGAVALKLALDHPGRVASLTLVASAGLGSEINMDYIEGFIGSTGRRDIKPHLEKLFADPSLVNRDMIDDILKFKRLDGVEAALRSVAGASFAGGKQGELLRERLGELKMPVQVIVGSKDQIVPPAHSKGLPGNVKVHEFDAGHMPHMEKSGDANRLIGALAT